MTDKQDVLCAALSCWIGVATDDELEALKDRLANPDWENCREWSSHISESMQAVWNTLPLTAKVAAYLVAEDWARLAQVRQR
jgi:hypothetical protein